MIKGILFDLDGVLTDTAHYHFQAWQGIAQELGISIDLTFNENLKGVDRMESLQRILKHGQMEQNFSLLEKEALATKKNQQYQALIASMTTDDLLPGIPAFLDELSQQGYRLGVASASHNAPMILNLLGITHFFDIIVDPSTIQHGKPAPDIFLKGQELLQLTAQEVIGIEDSYSGVEAIKQAGMKAIGVGDAVILKNADYVFATTAELSIAALKTHQLL